MNPEWVRKFVELVKSGAPIKAYQKKLGINKDGLKYHLGRLAEYEASLQSKKPEPIVPKPVAKVKEIIRRVAKRLDDEVVEYKEDKKDEKAKEDNAS